MKETRIQPRYFRVNEERKTSLAIYDYRLPGATSDFDFRVLLNGKRLCSCDTKAGFLLIVFLTLGDYRVTLQFGRGGKSAIERVVRIDRPGDYGLRVLIDPSYVGFDEPRFHPARRSLRGRPDG